MPYPLTRQLAPPAALPLSVADALLHLKADAGPEDAYVEGLIRAAAGWWEQASNLALMQTEYVSVFAGFSPQFHGLKWPIGEVVSIRYASEADVNTDALLSDYALSDGQSGAVLYAGTAAFPALRRGYAEPVRLRYTAGYATAADVPELIKQALRLTVGHWYSNRQNVVVGNIVNEVPDTARAILNLYREHVL